MKEEIIISSIRDVSNQLVKNWPLYSFVTSNPLAGLEHLPFEEAIAKIRPHLDLNGYPSATIFEQALNRGQIDEHHIQKQLAEKGITLSVEMSMARMQAAEGQHPYDKVLGDVDRHIIKWLTVFLDQGSTEWGMPGRENGFYKAWRGVARYDDTLPERSQIAELPENAVQALQKMLEPFSREEVRHSFKNHLLALPGWTGYIKHRMDNPNEWQQAFPITLVDYLAVRLALCKQLDEKLLPVEPQAKLAPTETDRIKAAWLKAMEETYRERLIKKVDSASAKVSKNGTSPKAQMVFCIDTRSERIRRAVEQSGPYQTFGYAGFFGVPMDYRHPEKNISHKSCPPIVDSAYIATESVQQDKKQDALKFDRYNNLHKALNKFRFTLKNNIPASFGYVESAGFFYGLGLLARTLVPSWIHKLGKRITAFKGEAANFSETVLNHKPGPDKSQSLNLSIDEKVGIAKNAFDLMGWDHFAPLVVFAGHGSQTANNPFGSSLDCGACAGNNGRHNARALAGICNDNAVRQRLANQHDIHIPQSTLFLAAEHNTTTNHIHLFNQNIPEQHKKQIRELKQNLSNAQLIANCEQFELQDEVPRHVGREARRRASDWAETRPEWGLAGNASFIIGPRELTSQLDLEARSFLHSYHWEKDPGGQKLEAILQGPMVVTQWINNHYYFATVDNDLFGGGTKVTQNITGKFGVVQGNGGDLKSGLPLESLQQDDYLLQHLPLRLTVLVIAPKSRVEQILQKHQDSLGRLIKNEWIHLTVLDPEKETQVKIDEKYFGKTVATT